MLPKNRPPTHPGEMLLEEFLKPLGVSQKEFAVHLGWTYARLNEIVNGKRGVSADSALAFGESVKYRGRFLVNPAKKLGFVAFDANPRKNSTA